MTAVIAGLDPADYRRSDLHEGDRIWPEKNCYVDVWIELLHALGLEPRAMLPFVVAVDFLGDQWTFFKPPHGELQELYGIDVQELTVWKPLLEHAVEHLAAGRLVSTEADSFWLPDTAGTDYRRNHVKTTIVLNAIDVAAQRLDYFHGPGYHRLEGGDFRGLFRVDAPDDPCSLPLFAEFMGIHNRVAWPPRALAQASRDLLVRHLRRAPTDNPVARFARRFGDELPLLQQRGLDHYHLWAFAGLRQLGAATELLAAHLRWLAANRAIQAEPAAASFEQISTTCKSLVLKGARAVNSRRALDVAGPCATMAASWDLGMRELQAALGSRTAAIQAVPALP